MMAIHMSIIKWTNLSVHEDIYAIVNPAYNTIYDEHICSNLTETPRIIIGYAALEKKTKNQQ